MSKLLFRKRAGGRSTSGELVVKREASEVPWQMDRPSQWRIHNDSHYLPLPFCSLRTHKHQRKAPNALFRAHWRHTHPLSAPRRTRHQIHTTLFFFFSPLFLGTNVSPPAYVWWVSGRQYASYSSPSSIPQSSFPCFPEWPRRLFADMMVTE